ncbi:nck-associated protein 5-like isoform X1 [Pleurodeles waltl]
MASEAVDVQQLVADMVPGDVLDLGVSRELLGRLRELEAENSALALANENQREAYERCLDEVANHVVQALLNQKDLREECLKLKKKVLDLERQNRTLSDLFHQKLQLSTEAVPQLQACPQPLSTDAQIGVLETNLVSAPVGLCTSQGSRERPRGGSPASSSLDALSPFLKKKAQILEVLRKLEEADPLLTCPSSHLPLAGHTDFSLQWKAERRWELSTASRGSTLADGVVPSITCGPDAWASRLLVAQNGLEDLLRWKTAGRGPTQENLTVEGSSIMGPEKADCGDIEPSEMVLLPSHCCHESSGPSSSSSSDDSGEQGDVTAPEKDSPLSLLSIITKQESDFRQGADSYLSVMIENGICGTVTEDRGMAITGQRDCETWDSKGGLPLAGTLSRALEREVLREISKAGQSKHAQEPEGTCHGMLEPTQTEAELSSSTSMWQEADKVTEIPSTNCNLALNQQAHALLEAQSQKQTFISTYIPSGCLDNSQQLGDLPCKSLYPATELGSNNKVTSDIVTSPCHGEPRPVPMHSPTKILKFLKMPSASDRTQNPSHLRLSPQLTRSSKIPCRNNYEVYHSPVPSRRSFRGEEISRCGGRGQLPLDGDPATITGISSANSAVPVHCSLVSVRSPPVNPSELFAQHAQKAPNYENILEITNRDSASSLQTCSSHLTHHLIRPVRESEVLEPPHPNSFSLPASPQGTSERSTQGSEPAHSNGTDLFPNSVESKSELEPSERGSSSLPSGFPGSKCSFPVLKPESGKKHLETPAGHLPFQVRLTALGKLKSAESLQPAVFTQPEGKEEPGAERESQVTANNQRNRALLARPCEMSESSPDCVSEPRVYLKRGSGSKSLRQADVCVNGESRVKCYHSNSVGSKAEAANCSPKSDQSSRHRAPPGSPQASRAHGRLPATGNSSKNVRSPHGSPTKMPAKSPLKTSAPRGPINEETKSCSPPAVPLLLQGQEEKQRAQQLSMGRRSVTCADYMPRTPPGTRTTEKLPLSSTLHSAIEEKVMKGIEENMLRLKEQDRAPVVEVKQKNSSGIASWFGLKKSKLPALNRRPEAFKVKEEKRSGVASPSRRDGRTANKKLEVESLNISMLMEKAEDLRKALEAEKAYMRGVSAERSRAHPGGIVMEQTQSELKVIYSKEVTPDNFMRQLLNRVDGKDVCESPLDLKNQLPDFQKVTRESKELPTSRPQRNGIVSHLQHCEDAPEQSEDGNIREEVPSDDSLTESVTSQHFTACGSLTRTLDSGIGTFPPPDYCSGTPNRSVPRLKTNVDVAPIMPAGGPPAPFKVPRKARTLEREVPSIEETFLPGQHHSVPAFHALLSTQEPNGGSRARRTSKDSCISPGPRTQQSKNWTFPNAKAPVSSTEVFLSSSREQVSVRVQAEGRKGCDLPHLTPHAPLAFPGNITRRTPSTSDMGEDGTPDLKSREAVQTGLESSESLSDSLYDSLSSCGSQG